MPERLSATLLVACGAVVVALTFWQELAKEVVGALATAVLVTVAGTFVATTWSKRRDERRARFELRNDLLQRASGLAQQMYVTCQHTVRVLDVAQTDEEREKAIYFLDEGYLDFATAGPVLEFELGARYGFTKPGDVTARDVANGVWEGWHQIRDLLAVYYFSIKDDFRGTLETNARGHGGAFHSGIVLKRPRDGVDDRRADIEKMQEEIREVYSGALRRLVTAILADDITTEKHA